MNVEKLQLLNYGIKERERNGFRVSRVEESHGLLVQEKPGHSRDKRQEKEEATG